MQVSQYFIFTSIPLTITSFIRGNCNLPGVSPANGLPYAKSSSGGCDARGTIPGSWAEVINSNRSTYSVQNRTNMPCLDRCPKCSLTNWLLPAGIATVNSHRSWTLLPPQESRILRCSRRIGGEGAARWRRRRPEPAPRWAQPRRAGTWHRVRISISLRGRTSADSQPTMSRRQQNRALQENFTF